MVAIRRHIRYWSCQIVIWLLLLMLLLPSIFLGNVAGFLLDLCCDIGERAARFMDDLEDAKNDGTV